MIKDIIDKNAEVKPNSKKLEALREYFAGCFTAEGAFDVERFKEMMKDEVNISNEGYSLDFLGKDYANLIASIDTTTVIEPDLEHNGKPENKDSENIYISGDNLDALKHLLKSYAGKVKCIYIDPPYNTGSDGFVYNDKFRFTPEELEKKLSIDEDEAKRILDLTSRGSSTHSAWLMFMSPRLQLARELLSKDGVIFISIDDNEQANLKLLCDYVFGEENFVAQFIWISKTGGGSDNNEVVADHEYVLCYSKNSGIENSISRILLESEELNLTDEYGPYRLGRELNKWGSNSRREDRPTMFFPIPGPNGEEVFPIRNDDTEGCWRWGKKAMFDAVENHNVEFSRRDNGTYIVYEKIRSTDPRTKPYRTFLKDCGTTAEGTKQIKALLGTKVFDYPKPMELVKNLLEIGSDDGDLIVDFFGGSSTTAHAIMELDMKEETSRRYILVQLPEIPKEGSEATKAGYHTIDEIGQERIKRAAAKIKAENPLFAGDLGFKHYTLREVPENVLDKLEEFSPDVSGFANNMLELFGRETVLETWKVRDGYGLNAKVEPVQLADYTAYQCGDHLYLTDEGMGNDAITALVDKYGEQTDWEPHYVVLFGYSFNFGTTSALKTNLPLLSEGEKQIKINIDIRY